jgi:uncharacterized membrane protein YdjX (TVP38/TMEM64 family)
LKRNADAGPETTEKVPSGRRKLLVLVLAALALAAFLTLDPGGAASLIERWIGINLRRFLEWVPTLGAWAPLVFILGYAVATVAFIPGSLLTLAAGAIFGLLRGTLYALLGATLGAAGAFLVARYLARGAIERKLAGNARFAAIDRAVGKEGLKIVALLRLSPVFPFNLLNYALGLTGVPFLHYLAASIAMLPGTLLYVYYGKAAGSLAAIAGGAGGAKTERGTAYWITLGIGLAATVVVTTFVTRLAGKALRQQIGEAPADAP